MKSFFVKVNIDILCNCFSFLVYQRSVQLLYEMLDTLIEALAAFTVRQCKLFRQTRLTNPRIKH